MSRLALQSLYMTALNSLRFYLTLVSSTLVFLCCQKRRRWCVLSILGITAVGIALMTYINAFLPGRNAKNLLVFVGAIAEVSLMGRLGFEIRWEEAVFCAVAGYGGQFIISLIAELCFRIFSLSSPGHFLCQMAFTALLVPVLYLTFGVQLKRGQNMDMDRRNLLPLMLGAVLTEVVLCYNLRLQWMVFPNTVHMLLDAALLVLCSVFILLAQFSLLVQYNLRNELRVVEQIRRKDRDQYEISSETIDLINRKCHDMRHQIRSIGQHANVTPSALDEMAKAISIYDSMYQTGSRALDIILTEKSLYCQKNNIGIRCIVDGTSLGFIHDADIYSLFGNILENAIHAVQELEEDNRVISLVVRRQGTLLSIHSHNPYTGDLVLSDGLPKTRNADSANHGFGTRSIAATANKYGGTVSFSAQDGIFSLNILFPQAE